MARPKLRTFLLLQLAPLVAPVCAVAMSVSLDTPGSSILWHEDHAVLTLRFISNSAAPIPANVSIDILDHQDRVVGGEQTSSIEITRSAETGFQLAGFRIADHPMVLL